jgi:hypothetical protein
MSDIEGKATTVVASECGPMNEFQTLKSWPNFASVRAAYRFPDAALAAEACCSFF